MKLSMFLIDEGNDFQQELKAHALAEAARQGVELTVFFTGETLVGHLDALRLAIEGSKPDAMIVMSLRDQGLLRIVRQAAAAGIHWVFLNRTEDDLDSLRRERPGSAICVVCADELEIGRIQGRQIRALLPAGGKVLCVQGASRSLTARERLAGLQEATADAHIEVMSCGGDWQPEVARSAVRDWLRLAARGRTAIDLISCQNDHLAGGALQGLADAAAELGRPELGRLPVAGCDGLASVGQKMVRDGRLVATVVLPQVGARAVDVIVGFLRGGPRPAPYTGLAATPFPRYEELRPLSRA